jgi:hypothetical protein
MQKWYWSGGISLLMLAPAWAEHRVLSAPAQNTSSVMVLRPVSADNMGPRSPGKLRDVLRQADDLHPDAAYPYRLSPRERQRLREQLRQQAWPTQPSR